MSDYNVSLLADICQYVCYLGYIAIGASTFHYYTPSCYIYIHHCYIMCVQEHDLDFSRLLDATEYKEKYREDMIRWGEEKRNKDPGYFCRIVASGPGSEKPVWIISDARRKTDVDYFVSHYAGRVKTVRVVAEEDVRKARGWVFSKGEHVSQARGWVFSKGEDISKARGWVFSKDEDVSKLEDGSSPKVRM